MAYAAWSVVANEQPSASKWNILGTNDAYFDGLIGSGTAYTSFTPTWTNLAVGTGGSAHNTGYYQQLGKHVHIHGRMVLGTSGQSVSTNPYFVLPVSISTSTYSGGSTYSPFIGMNRYVAGGAGFFGPIIYNVGLAANAAQPTYFVQSTTQIAGMTSSSPAVWQAGDSMTYDISYEAA